MLSAKQAASRACVSPSLIYSWCNTRVLPHLRLGRNGKGGKILIAEADLEGLLAAFKIGGQVSTARAYAHPDETLIKQS
jgi:hypothetical protein